jgi:hypothetical protein
VIAGLTLYPSHPQIIFGDGGTAKSYLALHIAAEMARRGQQTLFADWELDEHAHRRRLGLLYGSNPPRVLYVRCDRPLVHEADRLQRIVREHGVQFLVVDSIAFACDARPEDAEVAARYFRALRQIGVGSLSVAHVNKSDQGDQKPFGSAFWHNGARMTWYVRPGEERPNGLSVGLFNRKANLGPRLSPVGYAITFDQGHTAIDQTDVGDDTQLAKGLPIWQRVRQLVATRPLSLHALAEELGQREDSIERALKRKDDVFVRVPGADGVARWGLVSGARSAR